MLLEKRLHLIEEAVAVGFHGHAAFFGILHQQFFLPGRQFGGNLDLHRIDLVAGRASLEAGNPQSFYAEDFVMLRAGRDLDDGVALEGWHFDFPAEHSRDQVDRDITGNVEPFSLKDLMRFDGNGDVEITRGTAIGTMLAFIRETEPHAGLDSSWNMDRNGSLFVHALASLTRRTGFRDEMSGAFTLPAGSADAKKPLLKANLPCAFAAGTRLDGCRRLSPCAFAVGTEFPTRNLEFGFFPVNGFFKCNVKVVLQIVPALGSTAPTGSGLTEEVFEDVVEDVPKSASVEIETIKSWTTLLGPGMAEHVVAFPLLLIAQDLVSFIDFFEFFFSGFFLLFAGVQIGMMLAG